MDLADLILLYRSIEDPDEVEQDTLQALQDYERFARHHAAVEHEVLELRQEVQMLRMAMP